MTGGWAELQMQAVDARIALALRGSGGFDQGTVQSVQSDAFRAMVVFDGTSVAMPVLVAGHAGCIAGDRVVLQRFGSDWVIMGNVSALRWPGASGVNQVAGAGSSTGSYANMPGTPAFTFTKRWDATRARWAMLATCYGTVGTTVEVGISYNAGSTTVKLGGYIFANTGGLASAEHTMVGGIVYESGLAAGEYTVRGRWKGSATQDAGDWVSIEGQEVE